MKGFAGYYNNRYSETCEIRISYMVHRYWIWSYHLVGWQKSHRSLCTPWYMDTWFVLGVSLFHKLQYQGPYRLLRKKIKDFLKTFKTLKIKI
jgi:hypothetical protein